MNLKAAQRPAESKATLSTYEPAPTIASSMSDEQQNKKRKVTSESDNALDLPPLHNLLIKKHSEKARVPTRGSALAAGYDLYRLDIVASNYFQRLGTHECCSAEKKVIPARGKTVIDTQISIAVPPGTYGRVAPRSGLGEGYLPNGTQVFRFSHWMIFQLRSSTSIPELASLMPTTAVSCLYYCSILETRTLKVRFAVYAYDTSDSITFPSVNEGDRIAQLILERIYTPEISVVDVSLPFSGSRLHNDLSQDLEETIRGSGGFGSTGGHNGL